MTNRKFYKREITIEVIAEEPFPEQMDIEGIVYEAINGDYSMRITKDNTTEVNGKQAARTLIMQASDPAFFALDAHGNDIGD